MAVVSLLIPSMLVAVWLAQVHEEVPQPYLDEVFHVPQAKQYCAGHWTSWDPKITTPPGLYIIAALFRPLLGCSTIALRFGNTVCLVLTGVVLQAILSRSSPNKDGERLHSSAVILHHSINILLFPVLSFFSALYYTDVASTLSVIVFHYIRVAYKPTTIWHKSICLVLVGLSSLLFRQTNILWVAIYPAALELVRTVDQGHAVVKKSLHEGAAGFGDSGSNIVKTSWKMKVIYDPPVSRASVQDYLICLASIATCTLSSATDAIQLSRLLRATTPYIALATTFAAFVLWNGSVVLGDKSNHVATLHLPQMLYIWPYFTLFSWPLIYGHLLSILVSLSPAGIREWASQSLLQAGIKTQRPKMRYLLVFVLVAAAIVKYNTIVHPFTLADNRHYTFYVFRLLMRPWWVRYAVLPVYAVCAWACIQALGHVNSPKFAGAGKPVERGRLQTAPASSSQGGPQVSFVLAWLATSTLQLITAPLVEPRYFILPWIFWRMALVEAGNRSALVELLRSTKDKKRILRSKGTKSLYNHDLWIETAWFLLISAITGYIFLNWKFTWLSEPSTWQRFMW